MSGSFRHDGTNGLEAKMADIDREEVIIEVARLMWRKELSIAEFYECLGIDIDDLAQSQPNDVVGMFAGIFTGWKNPPTKSSPMATAAE